jgi:hypothetical protein
LAVDARGSRAQSKDRLINRCCNEINDLITGRLAYYL